MTVAGATGSGMPAIARLVRFAVAAFGNAADALARKDATLSRALRQAFIPLMPAAYLSLAAVVALAAALIGTLAAGAAVTALMVAGAPFTPGRVLVLVTLPAALPVLTYVAFRTYPVEKARAHARDVDARLPYAANFAAAMAAADVAPVRILGDLARQPVYGAVAKEMAWLTRDVTLFGENLPTAFSRAAARSPSPRMQDFLNGARTTIVSGGDLKAYFASKASQYMHENRRTQKEFLESLGLLAESYVTVVVAGPLFLLVLLSVMLVVSGGVATTQIFLYLLVFLALPLAHVAFSIATKNSAPEA